METEEDPRLGCMNEQRIIGLVEAKLGVWVCEAEV